MMTGEAFDNIDQQASHWAVRVANGTLTQAEANHLEAWLAMDPRHRGAFVRAQAGWRMLDRLRHSEPESHIVTPAPRAPLLTRRRLIACGSALAAGTAAAILLPPLLVGSRYSTTTGEVRRVPLADGSSATINTASTIDVRYDAERRSIRLVEGEAWFDVNPDPARPFLVQAGDIRVRAVGTAFSVRRRGESTDILVTEGVVEAWKVNDKGARAHIVAGSSASVDKGAVRPSPETEGSARAVERQLAWREGLIVLDGETLDAAVTEFNRYNVATLSVAGQSPEKLRLVGVFRATDPEAFAAAAAGLAGGYVQKSGNMIVIHL
ncbi:iron dicitrate transport regulator FecR [Sphingomonas oleivorans]|uniref:Iron dicitrate transport regulator FecR n=1 Tax=Sphingomonas oleivorans TaxID=1735121 RepID=A0A2T5G1T9_9SPHN|nr:FecR domain-containing protein [Sphingomonas oleivorans]PTQ13129.1 iron dicitrate transport regulator FecR [Sphingomonas oleivorans]